MTGLEIMALTEQGLQLITKVVELIQAAQKGEVDVAEAKRKMDEFSASMKQAVDNARAYLDEVYGKEE